MKRFILSIFVLNLCFVCKAGEVYGKVGLDSESSPSTVIVGRGGLDNKDHNRDRIDVKEGVALRSSSGVSMDNNNIRKKAAPILVYIVSPISSKKILPHDSKIPGRISKEIKLIATPGEYEPASFVIRATLDIHGLKVDVSDLEGRGGIIPSSNIDVKVVKCWYQEGNAWRGILLGGGENVLVPELLLNDDSLVDVDYDKKINYLKMGGRYISLDKSGDKYKDSKEALPFDSYYDCKIFSPADYPVKDAPELLPVDIPAHTNKQFWITVKVPDGAKAGIYKGRIQLLADKEKLGIIDLKLRVLPFKLARPKTYYDLSRDFESSLYYRGRLDRQYPNGSISSEFKSVDQLRAELRDMLAHGVTNPICFQCSDEELLGIYLRIREEVGIKGPLYYAPHGSFDRKAVCVRAFSPPDKIKKALDFFRRYGITEVYFYGIDEAYGEALRSQREAWIATKKAGGMIFASGFKGGNFEMMGDIQDLFIRAGEPDIKEAERWHSRGHKIWCYANPQGGVENPEVYRRNYGLLLWKSNYDGAATYAYQHSYGSVWNDFDHPKYRDHNFTYPTVDGVISTIAWEGYREGIDDIRYATTLKLEIERAKNSQDGSIKKRALLAEEFLETMDVVNGDLDVIRLEIIGHILELRKGAKDQ